METERWVNDLVGQTPWVESTVAQLPRERLEQILDEALDATFPCSDPVSTLCVDYKSETH